MRILLLTFVVWNGGRLFEGSWKDTNVIVASNLYWDTSGEPVKFAGLDLDEWRKLGKDAGSVVADPLFVNAVQSDFRLREGSPATSVGFKPFDLTRVGVYGPPAWRQLAATTIDPPVKFAPPPLPP